MTEKLNVPPWIVVFVLILAMNSMPLSSQEGSDYASLSLSKEDFPPALQSGGTWISSEKELGDLEARKEEMLAKVTSARLYFTSELQSPDNSSVNFKSEGLNKTYFTAFRRMVKGTVIVDESAFSEVKTEYPRAQFRVVETNKAMLAEKVVSFFYGFDSDGNAASGYASIKQQLEKDQSDASRGNAGAISLLNTTYGNESWVALGTLPPEVKGGGREKKMMALFRVRNLVGFITASWKESFPRPMEWSATINVQSRT